MVIVIIIFLAASRATFSPSLFRRHTAERHAGGKGRGEKSGGRSACG